MYVLDTAGSEGRDPLEDFSHLQRELELYAPNITTRPSLIVANKMDEQGMLAQDTSSMICAH